LLLQSAVYIKPATCQLLSARSPN